MKLWKFHSIGKPRWNIYGKEYVYTIHNQLIANPLTKRYHWHVKKPLNIELMQAAGNELLGTHDFTTLKGTNSTPADPVKTIMGIHVEGKGPHVTIFCGRRWVLIPYGT